MRLDSHQHFWSYSPRDYPWISDKLSVLKRDYLPSSLLPELDLHSIGGSIAVQARQCLEENDFLLGLAAESPSIKGVVGWVDLQSDRVEEQLSKYARESVFKGVRHVVQDEPDNNFLLRPGFVRGITKLKQFGLTYDLLVFPHQLPAAIELVSKFPEQRFVLDHIAKPAIGEGKLSPWKEQITELAKARQVFCKVSGMVTEANWEGWKKEDFRPYLDHIFECFTPARLMFGSDWPVCLLAGSYSEVFELVADYIAQYPSAVRERILGENAVEFYSVAAG